MIVANRLAPLPGITAPLGRRPSRSVPVQAIRIASHTTWRQPQFYVLTVIVMQIVLLFLAAPLLRMLYYLVLVETGLGSVAYDQIALVSAAPAGRPHLAGPRLRRGAGRVLRVHDPVHPGRASSGRRLDVVPARAAAGLVDGAQAVLAAGRAGRGLPAPVVAAGPFRSVLDPHQADRCAALHLRGTVQECDDQLAVRRVPAGAGVRESAADLDAAPAGHHLRQACGRPLSPAGA